MLESLCQASVPRDVFPPTPPGPEGSNGNGLLRVQWGAGAWLFVLLPVHHKNPESLRPHWTQRERCGTIAGLHFNRRSYE